MLDVVAILQVIRGGYALPLGGTHGLSHWARVLENGLRVADVNGADRDIVTLFALFHDSRRVNEYRDHGHGQRGGELARSLRGRLLDLDDARFDLLFEACRLHTDGQTTDDPTVGACWDADRLDLGRVGIQAKAHLLSTEAARELVPWADRRSRRQHVPSAVLEAWGVDGGWGRAGTGI